MAGTPRGRRLTEQHRQAQIAVRARFLTEFLPVWSLLDWARLDVTAPAWVRAAMLLVRPFRQDSADLAAQYYSRLRQAEVPTARVPAPVLGFAPEPARLDLDLPRDDPSPGVASSKRLARRDGDDGRAVRLGREVSPRTDWSEWDAAAERSLLVTGPGELKRRAGRGQLESRARPAALEVVSGSAARHVLNGGRDTVLTLVAADEKALGWTRVTDADPCAFCALLASRGPVYASRETTAFQAHDRCACVPEPVFSRAAAWPGRAREFQRLYYASTKGFSGQDAINAFRRAYERQRREAAEPAAPLTA